MSDAERSEQSRAMRIAIIGTGPVSMLKALFLAEQNPQAQITLIDSASQTGGAWYSDYSPKGHLIECGCHIWSYSPPAYKYIEEQLGVPLVDMLPDPVFVTRRFSLPYSLKNTLDTYKTFFKSLLLFRFSELKEINQRPNTHYRILGKKNRYPKTGSPELIHALEKKIAAHRSIQIMLNTRITKLEIAEGVVISSDSARLEFDKLYMTFMSHIDTLILPLGTLNKEPRRVDYIHFLVSSDRPLKKKMSYWRLMNDEVVHRITDISYQTGREEHLLLIGIKAKAFAAKDENTLFSHSINLLKKYGLAANDQKFGLVKTHVFPACYMNYELFDAMTSFRDKIEVLHTTDLMYGIYYLLRSETPHLINTPK